MVAEQFAPIQTVTLAPLKGTKIVQAAKVASKAAQNSTNCFAKEGFENLRSQN